MKSFIDRDLYLQSLYNELDLTYLTKYNQSFDLIAKKFSRSGCDTDLDLCIIFNINLETLYNWFYTYPSFTQSVMDGIQESIICKEKHKAKSLKSKEWKKQYREKNKDDPKFRVSNNFMSSMRSRLKNRTKGIFESVGYSVDELMSHLESKFKGGMTWDNYGKYWHVDHIKPVVMFNYECQDDDEFKECWALNNLQPLYARENLSKGSKYNGSTQRKQICTR